jgi:16S rRNA G1207 methylase RsmC
MAEHYFTKKPTSELREQVITVLLKGEEYTFYTGSSMFSPSKVDLGTRVLIAHAKVEPERSLLDLGCGYGPVGIVFAKIAKVTMTDVNERAVKYARKNAKVNNVKIEVLSGDMYDAVEGKKFDVILLNPPQAAGKKVCNVMIEQAPKYLKKGGNLQIVARHQKGGKQFELKMQEVFGNVEILGRKSGYRVYMSRAQ